MTTATLPENPLERSKLERLLHTPLRDLLRGRVTGRFDVAAVVLGAGLTPPLSTLVLATVRKTHLWRLEKVDVARELVAHFLDGVEAGASAESLVASFGDPAQAARLIRRAKKRNRPWAWRAARMTVRGTVLLVGIVLALYTLQTARFYMGSPTIKEDFRPRFNAVANAAAESDRAWPLYRQALIGMPLMPVVGREKAWEHYSREPEPGEPGWEVMEAFLNAQSSRLALVRQAAAMPALGRAIDFKVDDADRALWPQDAEIDGDFHTHSSFELLMPHLASLRQLVMALSADAHRAAFHNDGGTVVADIDAMLGIVRHCREQSFVINDLVAIACFNRGVADVVYALEHAPASLTDDHLARLAHLLGAMSDERLQVRLDGEEWAFEDLLQRLYTDDGNGDGRLTPAGFKLMNTVASTPGILSDVSPMQALAWPAGAAIMQGRRDMREDHQRVMGMLRAEATTPLWLRGPSQADQLVEEWAASNIDRLRRLPLMLIIPALSKATLNAQQAMLKRDGALLAIALELFHRRNGAWPVSQDDLVPSLLPAAAIDRFDGKPLRFVIRDDRPVVYSVGADRDDDGGNWPLTHLGTQAQNNEVSRWLPLTEVNERLKYETPNAGGSVVPNPYDGDWILFPAYHDPYPLIPPPNPDGS